MDNNSNFEQQFTQEVKASVAQPVYESSPAQNKSSSKALPIVAIILAVTVLVESIVLAITLTNYFASFSGSEEAPIDESSSSDNTYSYDADGDLIGMSLTCTAQDGSSYALKATGSYQQLNNLGIVVNSGTYTLNNGSLISFSDNDKVLYYDGFDIADGLNIYECTKNDT